MRNNKDFKIEICKGCGDPFKKYAFSVGRKNSRRSTRNSYRPHHAMTCSKQCSRDWTHRKRSRPKL